MAVGLAVGMPHLLTAGLGAAGWADREAASAALAAGGPAHLAAVRRAAGHPDPEVRERAGRLAGVIERATALPPRTVRLAAGPWGVKEAVDEVTRQTGYPVQVPWLPAGVTVAGSPAGETFWQAVERCRAAADRGLEVSAKPPHLELAYFRKSQFVALDGAFRVELTGVGVSRQADLTIGHDVPRPLESRYTLDLRVLVEPRFELVEMSPISLSAEDQDGEPAEPTDDNESSRPGATPWHRTATVGLKLPDVGRRLRAVRGEFEATVVRKRTRAAAFPDPVGRPGMRVRLGAAEVAVECGQCPDGELVVTTEHPPTDTAAAPRWFDCLRVEAADGRRWGADPECGPSADDRNRTSGACCFVKPPWKWQPGDKPARLVVDDLDVVRVPVRIAFRGVPLP